jgi:hypothetical protein
MDPRSDSRTMDRPTLAFSQSPAERLLSYIHFFSPLAILFFFLAVFTVRSMRVTSPIATNNANGSIPHRQMYGPGGKPLPQRKATGLMRERDKQNDFPRNQKLSFQWLSILAATTFFASGVVIIVHALTERRHPDGYWCGQAVVVSSIFQHPQPTLKLDANLTRCTPWAHSLSIRCSVFPWLTPNPLQLAPSFHRGFLL